ncbi:MAG: hypothetical protein HY740_08150, partial [Chloroflexi bacterium]|nr:hypothetical protein [Chloroflexota bacterium]
MSHVTRREYLWVIIVATIIMALTTVPYIVGAIRSNDDWRFSGFVFGVEDGNSYLAKMQLGAHGEFLFQLSYAFEDHPKALFFPLHILLGKLTGWIVGTDDVLRLHTALILTYHLSRITFGIVLLLVIYRFLAELLPRLSQRRVAFILIAVGGGLGWLLILFRAPEQPLELYSPEAFTFLDLYGLPHLSASRALMLGLIAGACWLTMTLIQPFYMLIIFVLIALHVFALAIMTLLHKDDLLRGIDLNASTLRALWIGAMAGAFGLPLTLYSFLLFLSNTIYKVWSNQNVLPSPSWWVYLAAWGLFVIIGIFGVRSLYRRNLIACVLIVMWILVVPILIYIPYNLQRRFSEAVYVPMIALAIGGVTAVFSGRRRVWRLARRYVPILLILLSLPMTLILWIGGINAAMTYSQPIYQDRDQVATYVFLGKNLPPRANVLSSYQFGNAVPAYGYLVAV